MGRILHRTISTTTSGKTLSAYVVAVGIMTPMRMNGGIDIDVSSVGCIGLNACKNVLNGRINVPSVGCIGLNVCMNILNWGG